jgi:glycerol kinase
MAYIVAIDAGTTGVRARALSLDGAPSLSSYKEFTQYFPQPGWVEHDAEEIWAAVLSTLREVCSQLSEPPIAIGITNQRETLVAWDRASDKVLAPAIVWQDRRTADRCLELANELPTVRRITGLVLDPYFTGTKAEWLLRSGAVTPTAHLALGTIDSWILWRLSGGTTFATDESNASRTMLYDIQQHAWSHEMCALLSIPMNALPDVRNSSGVFAITDVEGIPRGIPISGIAGDQQAALFGQACFTPGTAKNTYGTGSFVLMNVGTTCPTVVDGMLNTVAWRINDTTTYAVEGSIFVTGAAVQWLRDGLHIIDNAKEVEALAMSVPDAGGVVMVPALTGLGSPWWDPYARGGIFGISRGTTRAHLARATLESVAFQTRDVIEAMTKATGITLTELRADGGATDNSFLMQFQADQLQVPVVLPVDRETTSCGAAFLAGLGIGAWASTTDISAQWASNVTYFPNNENLSVVDASHAQWLNAVQRVRTTQ